jgi:putative heme-binding domain-containing protein
MPRRDILRSIFFPHEKVDPKYVTTVIATKDGKTLRGLVVSDAGPSVSLKTATDAEPIAIAKAQIAKRTTEPTSIMPADIADQVTDTGVRDVTAYVMRTVK